MPSAHVDGSPTVSGHDRDFRYLRSAALVDRTDRKPRSSRRSADRGGHDPGPVWQRAIAGQPADPDDLPPPTPRFLQHLADSDDIPPSVEADVAAFKVMNGDVRPFDEPAVRAMLERCWARATDPSAAAHHGLIGRKKGPDLLTPLSTITAPTTIVHGDHDPIFTLAHGEALTAAIPDAHLHVVSGMGHVYFSPGLPEQLADLISVAAPNEAIQHREITHRLAEELQPIGDPNEQARLF